MPDYLYNVVNTQKNESWQKKQAIEAIKLLFKRIHAPLYQDIDFGFNQIIVRDTKGNKERVVPLPATLTQHFKNHLSEVKLQHVDDIDQGFGQVYMSQALVKKYGKSNHQWVWQ